MTQTTMTAGTEVRITCSQQTDDGCWIYAGDVGTLMTDMGDGDWLVYIPAKGSPMLRAGDDFEA